MKANEVVYIYNDDLERDGQLKPSAMKRIKSAKSLTIVTSRKLKRLPDGLTQLQFLDCNESSLEKIPSGLVNLKKLVCYNTKITELPGDLGKLESLLCFVTKIKEIPSGLSNLKTLMCFDTDIKEIPSGLGNLKELWCTRTRVKELPGDLVELERLEASHCPNLERLEPERGAHPKHLSRLKSIECHDCPELEGLPEKITQVEFLDCSRCAKLKKIPDGYVNLHMLKVDGCKELASIPHELKALRYFYRVGTPKLTRVGAVLGNLITYTGPDPFAAKRGRRGSTELTPAKREQFSARDRSIVETWMANLVFLRKRVPSELAPRVAQYLAPRGVVVPPKLLGPQRSLEDKTPAER